MAQLPTASSIAATMEEKSLSRKRVAESIEEQQWPKRPRISGKTDKSRWRLNDDNGRHSWVFVDDDEALKETPQSYAEKYYLGLPLVCSPASCSPRRLHTLMA